MNVVFSNTKKHKWYEWTNAIIITLLLALMTGFYSYLVYSSVQIGGANELFKDRNSREGAIKGLALVVALSFFWKRTVLTKFQRTILLRFDEKGVFYPCNFFFSYDEIKEVHSAVDGEIEIRLKTLRFPESKELNILKSAGTNYYQASTQRGLSSTSFTADADDLNNFWNTLGEKGVLCIRENNEFNAPERMNAVLFLTLAGLVATMIVAIIYGTH